MAIGGKTRTADKTRRAADKKGQRLEFHHHRGRPALLRTGTVFCTLKSDLKNWLKA
jgi:hypothetical protein